MEVRPYVIVVEMKGLQSPRFEICCVDAFDVDEAMRQAMYETFGRYGEQVQTANIVFIGPQTHGNMARATRIPAELPLLRMQAMGRPV